MEPRVQRLLKDARAAVSQPMRPETPREPLRPNRSRLNSALTSLRSPLSPNDGDGEPMSPSTLGTPNSGSSVVSVQRWLALLEVATTLEDRMATLASMGQELRLIRPSEEDAAVVLLERLVRVAAEHAAGGESGTTTPTVKTPEEGGGNTEATSHHMTRLELSVRAASTACRIAMNGASPAFSNALVDASRILSLHATSGRGALLKKEMVLDTLIQMLRMQSHGWCRDAIANAAATLRYCSSEGGALLVHLATLGLLAVTNQLALRVLPTRDTELLCHCAAIYRNVSVDYAHHFERLQCLGVMLQLLQTATACSADGGSGAAWKEIAAALARAFAKLVFDDACMASLLAIDVGLAAGLPASSNPNTRRDALGVLMDALAVYASSRMIVARLGTTLDLLLQGISEEAINGFCVQHEASLRQLLQSLSVVIRKEQQQQSCTALLEEAVQSTWRLVGTLSMCAEGGMLLATCAPHALLLWLAPRLDVAATATTQQRDTMLLSLMCLSNLSYYAAFALGGDGDDDDGVNQFIEAIGPVVAGLLFSRDTEVVVEATRILGNLSRTDCGRSWIETHRCDEVCLVLLQHEDLRIVYNCFGVALNLCAADRCRLVEESDLCAQLLQHTGTYHLLDVSGDEGSDSAQVSTVVEKLLCNLSGLV